MNFYQEVFLCEPLSPERNISGEWLETGTAVKHAAIQGMHLRLPGYQDQGPTLEIFSYNHMLDQAPPAANRQGLGHLAFLVEDVAYTLQQVIAHGGSKLGSIVTHTIDRFGVLTFVYAADPEGNILEIQHYS